MSERERWVVYPLLFLALGAALRDKLFDRTTAKRIVCEELTVCDELTVLDGAPMRPSSRPLVRIGRTEAPAGGAARGYVIVDGHVEVAGEMDAHQYAHRGTPFVPAASRFVITPMDVLRTLEQSKRLAPQRDSN